MKITIESTQLALSIVVGSLKISRKQFNNYMINPHDVSEEAKLVRRILKTRNALELGNSDSECCYDYAEPIPCI